jgi:transmembrane protein 132
LVRKVMRVVDPRVASLKMTSGFIEGLKPGKTEVQVLSPMSGHVIAARELRVLADKVDVSSLSVRLIAGLSLSLSPDPDLDSCFVAQVEASDRLHSRYQEAILDLTVHFSDGSASPLRLTDRSHYNLVVESHNTSILALTSPARANIPRVLALGEGRATLSVTFSSACTTTTASQIGGDGIGDASHSHRQGPAHPLATTMAVIQLALTGHPATSVQNDARTESSGQLYTLPQGGHGNGNQIIGDSRRNGGGGGKMASASAAASAATGRLAQPNQGQLTFSKPGSIEFGVNENQLSLKDDSNAVMMSNAGRELHQHPAYPSHYPGGFGSFSSSSFQHMGPLEIGMYVLLAIFCAAIVVFVGTCIVYASRARKGLIPTDDSDQQHIDRQAPTTTTIDPWPSLWNRLKKMNPKGGGGGSDEQRGRGIAGEENEDEEEGTDKGWIWLGRSTLDPEVPRRQTRPLSTTGAGARPVSSNATGADVSANRLSGISYTGSEVSVRIVGRPSGQDGGRLSYKAQLCFEPLKDAADDDDDDIDHDSHHPNSWPGSVDSKTFTKASNSSQQQQELLHHHPGALRIITNQLAAAEEPLLLSDVVRRPSNNRRAARRASEQDTRRYARSWLMAGEAVPRDFNSNPSILMDSSDAEEEDEEEEIQDLGCHVPDAFPNAKKNLKLDLSGIDKKTDSEYNVATFLRHGSPDIKQANIIENPRFSPTAVSTSVEVEDDAELSAVGGESVESHPSAASALDVDYDRIISYLGILKETST